jgi:GrpB-like predicted nucleotidyltransferase (UPF0157 family)
MIDRITVVDYDPAWPQTFVRLRDRIMGALGDFAEAVEHVGGTAVPGLPAKPVIDIDVVVPSPEAVPVAIERLATLGYQYEGDLGIHGREAFRWPVGEPRHHVYVCPAGSDALREHLLFRDYLRSHAGEAEAYGRLKKQAALAAGEDRGSYQEAKGKMIERIMSAAATTQN